MADTNLDEFAEYINIDFEKEPESQSFNEDWDLLISEESKKYPNIPEKIVRSLIQQESSGNPYAEIYSGDRHGYARGLGQFIDATAKEFIPDWKDPSDSYDPVKNIRGIYNYLNHLYKKEGSIDKALYAYHGKSDQPDAVGKTSKDYVKEVLQRSGTNTIENQEINLDEFAEFANIEPAEVISQEQIKPTEQKGYKPTLGTALGHAGVAGLATATEGFYSVPAGITTAFLGATNALNKGINYIFGKEVLKDDYQVPDFLTENKLVQIPKEVAEEQSAAAKGRFEQGDNAFNLVKKGNIGKLGEYLGQFVLEQAPNTVGTGVMIANNIPKMVTLGMMAMSTSGLKQVENKEKVKKGEISPLQSQINATLNGAFESLFEATGEYKVLEGLSEVYKQTSKEIGKELADKQLKNILKEILKGFAKGAGQEVPSEVVTQFAQDMTDRISGVNPEITNQQILENMIDAGAGTLLMGGIPGAMTSYGESTQQNKAIREQRKIPKKEIVASPVESFAGTGSVENFNEAYNQSSGEGRVWLMRQLTPEEQTQVREPVQQPTEELKQEINLDEFSEYAETPIEAQEAPIIPETTPTIPEQITEPTEAPTDVTEQITPEPEVQVGTKDETGIPSGIEEGEITVEEEPVKETGTEEIARDRVLQEQEEINTDKLIEMGLSDKRKDKDNLKKIVIDSGIDIKKGSNWQTYVLEYAKKNGTTEDINKIQSLIGNKNIKTSESIKTKQKERLKETGSTKTISKQKELDILSNIVNQSIVEYNPDIHSDIVSIKDNKPIFKNNQLKQALDIEYYNNKPYITIKDNIYINEKGKEYQSSGIDILQNIIQGKTESFKEEVRRENSNYNQEKEVIEKEYEYSTKEKINFGTIGSSKKQNITTEEKGVESKIENIEVENAVESARKRLKTGLKAGQIDQATYDKGMKTIRAMEADYGLKEYNEDFSDIQYTKAGGEKGIKVTDIQKGDIEKTIRSKFNVDEDVGITFTDVVMDKSGKIIKLSGKDGVADAFITTKKNGKKQIFVSNDLSARNAIGALIHETSHLKENIIDYDNKKIAQKVYDAFIDDIDSKFTKELESRYEKDINNLKEKFGENADEQIFELVKSEWLAERVREIELEKIDENGNYTDKKKPVLQKIVEAIKDFLKRALKLESKDARIRRVVSEYISEMQKTKEVSKKKKTQYQRVKEEPKKKRRKINKKQRLKTYATDRLHLELGTDIKNAKLRFFAFANKHFYSKNAQSYRRQIFDLLDKVNEIGDVNYKKLLKIIDEFSDWQDAGEAYRNVEKFKKNNKNILKRKTDAINEVNDKLKRLDEKYQMFEDYQTLKRLADRGEVTRPYKKGTTVYTNPSEKYLRLLKRGVLSVGSFKSGAYEMNYKGSEYLNKLRERLTNSESGQMFNVNDISTIFNEIQQSLKEYSSGVKELQSKRDKQTEDRINEISKYINDTEFEYKGKNILRKAISGIGKFVKPGDINTSNLEYILNSLDKFDENGVLSKYIFDDLDKGRNRTLRVKQRIQDFMKDILKDIPRSELLRMDKSFQSGIIGAVEKLTTNKTDVYTFRDAKGGNVNISPAQKIQIYMLSKNESGLRHLLDGGISLNETGKIYKLDNETVKKIEDDLSENEKKIADMYFKVGEMYKQMGNKVSNEMVGYDIFTEENYHPILVRGDHIENRIKEVKNFNDLGQFLVETSPSAFKARKKSGAPVILEGSFAAFSRTAPMIEKYIGSALSSKNVNSILNSKAFRQSFNNKGLDVEYRMIKKLIENYNGDILRIPDIGERTIKPFYNIFTQAVLGYKATTTLMQFTSYLSYLSAMNDIKLKDTAKVVAEGLKISPNEFKRIQESVVKHSPYLRERFEGYSIQAIGEMKKEAEARDRVTGGKKGWRKVLSTEGAMSPMIGADRLVVTMIWKSVEQEYRSRGLNPSEHQSEIAKKVNKIVRRTQATSDILDRPEISNPWLLKPVTMFMSEPIKRIMMIRRSVKNFKNDPLRETFNLGNVLVLQPLMIELIRSGIMLAAGKTDELPEDEKEWLKWFAKRMAINNIGMYPVIGSAAATIFSGFDVNLGGPAQEILNRFVQFNKSLCKYMVRPSGKNKKALIKNLERFSASITPYESAKTIVLIINNITEKLKEA